MHITLCETMELKRKTIQKVAIAKEKKMTEEKQQLEDEQRKTNNSGKSESQNCKNM